jgi:transposase-like protein
MQNLFGETAIKRLCPACRTVTPQFKMAQTGRYPRWGCTECGQVRTDQDDVKAQATLRSNDA